MDGLLIAKTVIFFVSNLISDQKAFTSRKPSPKRGQKFENA